MIGTFQNFCKSLYKTYYFLIFIYAILLLPIFFSNAFVPDELAFLRLSQDQLSIPGQGLFSQQNLLGYGAIYWIIYGYMDYLFGDFSIWVMRGIAYFIFLSIPAAITFLGINLNNENKFWALLLYLSMPLAWWTGKLTGPEVFMLPFCVVSICMVMKMSNKTSTFEVFIIWLMLGVAVGIKLNAIPLCIFSLIVVCATLLEAERKFNQKNLVIFSMIPIGALTGIVISNPFVIFNPIVYATHINEMAGTPVLTIDQLNIILQNKSWTWDMIFSGGFFNTGFSKPSFMVLVLTFIFASPKKHSFALVLSLITAVMMLLANGTHYNGWYWFPTILIIPLYVLCLRENYFVVSALMCALLLNVISQSSLISKSYQKKLEHAKNIGALDKVQACLDRQALDGEKFNLIVDHSEIPSDRRLNFDRFYYSKIIKISDDAHGNQMDTSYPYISAEPFLWLLKIGEEGIHENKILVILGDRLKSKHRFADFEKYLMQDVFPKSTPGYRYEKIIKCEYASFYEINLSDG